MARRAHTSLYNWIVYKRGSKAKERKGEEREYRLKLYIIIQLRNGSLPVICGNLLVLSSTIFYQCRNITPPSIKACP